ncbi:MAG TPA: hypothetical protein PKL31_04100 [Fulvivirga sp.]|nr:hypothetical protein [Fulvivirga sp.]
MGAIKRIEEEFEFISFVNQFENEGIKFNLFNDSDPKSVTNDGITFTLENEINHDHEIDLAELFYFRLSKLPLYKNCTSNEFIERQKLFINQQPKNIQDEYTSLFDTLNRGLENFQWFHNSNLKSQRQIAGFYWYVKQSSQNFAFQYHTENIVGKYRPSDTSFSKAKREYADFQLEGTRKKGTSNNIDDLEIINLELKRLGINSDIIIQDLKDARVHHESRKDEKTKRKQQKNKN